MVEGAHMMASPFPVTHQLPCNVRVSIHSFIESFYWPNIIGIQAVGDFYFYLHDMEYVFIMSVWIFVDLMWRRLFMHVLHQQRTLEMITYNWQWDDDVTVENIVFWVNIHFVFRHRGHVIFGLFYQKGFNVSSILKELLSSKFIVTYSYVKIIQSSRIIFYNRNERFRFKGRSV